MSAWVFWISAVCLVHIYLGYPVLAFLAARLRPRPVRKQAFDRTFSVVVVAWNEEKRIAAKLASILGSGISDRILDLLVASDGSTDRTAAAARAVADPRIRVIEYPARRGKAATLNDAVPECRGEIVVLTDARQELDPNALGNLLAAFADERVGVVSGELVFRRGEGDTAAAQGIGAYWSYEKFIRKQESRFGSVPGATGALYAIRRELFKPIPTDSLLVDVVIPMQPVLRGFRCVFEETAWIYDTPSQLPSQEAVRKRRTIAGNAQLIQLYPGWLLPWRNPIWFQYVSHKMGRLLSPFLLLGCVFSNILLLRQFPYAILGAMQGVLYLAALAGWFLQRGGDRSRSLFAVPFMFVSLNAVTLFGVWDAIRGRTDARWFRLENANDP